MCVCGGDSESDWRFWSVAGKKLSHHGDLEPEEERSGGAVRLGVGGWGIVQSDKRQWVQPR